MTNTGRKLRSLWFDAGTFYTLGGTGLLTIGDGYNLSGLNYLVVVNSDGTSQSEHNINNTVRLTGPSRSIIRNDSEGGLRFGGPVRLGDTYIQIRGTGATHFANDIVGANGDVNTNGNIEIIGAEGAQASQPHFILHGYNKEWGGWLHAFQNAFVLIKGDQSIGRGSEKHAHYGGTIGLRSHLETPLVYQQPYQNNYIEVWELGIARTGSTQRIGAIYNDGGRNSLDMRIELHSTPGAPNEQYVGFGSRGDRGGGLDLQNTIKGTGTFVKLGPGLIVLSNDGSGGKETNRWDKETILRAGVLRLTSSTAIPSNSHIILDGGAFGGILELGWGNFNRSLGTGNSNIRWTGDGGFSAFGGARSVTIGGGTLTWGGSGNMQHFIRTGNALLLSSRYADNVITFTNAINLNNGLREVRVDRGENAAHAVLSGVLSGDGGGLVKTGDGLLLLTGANTYTGATRIEGGALLGADANTGSNIQLGGGVLGIDGNFSRGLGGGGSQIRWDGSGGFVAYGNGTSIHEVNIGGANATLTWGTANFIGSGSELRFGHYTASGTVRWQNALDLGNGNRTIRIERGSYASYADVEFNAAISGTGTLNFLGNGHIDLFADNSGLSAHVVISGAQLRLYWGGRLANASSFDIRHGGSLELLNNASGWTRSDRLADGAALTFAAGTLRLSSTDTAVSEKVGDLILESGANAIRLSRNGSESLELHANALTRSGNARATLNVTGDLNDSLINFKLTNSAVSHEVGGIIPWGTNDDAWLTAHSDDVNGPHFLKALVNYFGNQESNWSIAHNVKTDATVTLGGNKTINSLILGGDLNLGSHTLTINSGGLMVTGNRSITDSGTITTASAARPLYIHNSGTLTFGSSARLTNGMDVVKTRGGSLVFNNNSSVTHEIGSLYVHQGTVELRGSGNLRVGAGDHRIYIGDGAGTDKLILPGGRWNPITKDGDGLPSITLRGTPYDPRGPEYGGDQAILQLGGNGGSDGKTYGAGTKQKLANLHIEGRGTIDWRGGEVGLANILWVESLSFSSTSDRLFIRNWYEYEDLFLVRRDNFHTDLLPQIIFEGYQDYVTTWKEYDANYIQITPFGQGGYLPEPSTYGAILGAVGVALWTWRKRRAASDK